MKRAITIKAELDTLKASVNAIIKLAQDEERELTEEEKKEVEEALGDEEEGGKTEGKIKSLVKQLESARKYETSLNNFMQERAQNLGANNPYTTPQSSFTVPARAKAVGALKHFKSHEDAYAAGQFYLAAVYDRDDAKAWCKDHGVFNAMRSDENSLGGFLVPTPLAATIIELREKFGVFRQNAQYWPMASGTDTIPKLTGDVVAYFTAQMEEIQESDASLGQIALAAKDLFTLTAVSRQVSDDAIIAVAELITRSIASAMAAKEDKCGFNGTGTSEFGGIKGLAASLLAGAKVVPTGQKKFADLTMGQFEAMKGKVKRYDGFTPAWYISSTGYYASMERLLNAAGGNTNINLASGAPLSFLGDPVVFANVMHDGLADATGKIACYYGDLRMSAVIGDRAGLSIEADRSIYFKKNAIAIKGWSRFDIQVHEVGDAEKAGSIVGLEFGA